MEIQQMSLAELSSYQILSSGFESTIYIKDNIAIKKYYAIDSNKMEKIKLLNKLNLPFLTNPEKLIEIDGKIDSFSMQFKRGYYPIGNSRDLPVTKKIELLKQLLNIINELHKNNIIYGDLNPKNIICNGDTVYLTDVVNIKIGKYPFDEISSTMKNYFNRGGTEESLDYYMFNLLTLYFLNEIEYQDLLSTIETTLIDHFNNNNDKNIIGLTDNLDCMNIGYQMLNPTQQIDLLIDYIDPEIYKNKTKN